MICLLTDQICFQYIFKVSDNIIDKVAYLIHPFCQGQYCPENCRKDEWNYVHDNLWTTDNTLRVECGKNRIHIIVDKAKHIDKLILLNHEMQ